MTTNFIAICLIILLIFLICREITCWYFKINEGIAILKEIRDCARIVTKEIED